MKITKKQTFLRIRKGKASDAKVLLELLNGAAELQSNPDGECYTLGWVKGCLTDKKMSLVLIAEDAGKIAGFITAELWKSKKYSFLNDIFVREEYRKKGVASLMMNEYARICKKLKFNVIMELVLTDNARMQNWSEKKGFARGNMFYYYTKKL